MLYDTDTGYMNFLFESSVDTLYFRVFSELAIWPFCKYTCDENR